MNENDIKNIEKWLPSDYESTAKGKLRALVKENQQLRKQLQLAIEQNYCTICGRTLANAD